MSYLKFDSKLIFYYIINKSVVISNYTGYTINTNKRNTMITAYMRYHNKSIGKLQRGDIFYMAQFPKDKYEFIEYIDSGYSTNLKVIDIKKNIVVNIDTTIKDVILMRRKL